MKKLKSNTEDKSLVLESGKTYKFAGYSWTACEVNNDRHVAVIQSRGVTHGAWPGFKMTEFDSKYSIDGYDISAYDVKTKKLYDAIKDVEDKSASYGKGLYLVSKEKVGFTEWGHPGSGNYWQALKAAAENACSFGSPDNYAWLGTVYGSGGAWYVNSNGGVSYNDQSDDYVVAPVFNLDLSKVEIVDDEIVIRKSVKNARNTKKEKIREFFTKYMRKAKSFQKISGMRLWRNLRKDSLKMDMRLRRKTQSKKCCGAICARCSDTTTHLQGSNYMKGTASAVSFFSSVSLILVLCIYSNLIHLTKYI